MVIYLVGYMGAGKSSVGRKLARRLGYSFVDLDEAFHEEYGSSVRDYITLHGERAFRRKESELLRRIPLENPIVIATGGGAPCHHDNMSYMNRTGVTVYLKMHPRSLAKRLTEAKTTRPLLSGLTGQELLSFIRQHLSEREFYYRQAVISVKGEDLDISDLEEKLKAIS